MKPVFVLIVVCAALASCGGDGTSSSNSSGSTSSSTPNAVPVLDALAPSNFQINASFFATQHFGQSPPVSADQGYATNNTHNFLFSTAKIVETDSQWNVTYTNSSPFSGIGIKVKHLGDGEVSGGEIFAPLACATQEGCTPEAVAIGVYAADTAGLPLQRWADITSSGCDGSSIAVGPNETLYVSNFFMNPGILCLFDAKTLETKGTLELSTPIPRIQGISFDPTSQRFAVTADNADRTIGYLFFVSLSGQVVGPVYTMPQNGELEGLDFTQGYIGYVIEPDNYVYFLFPIQLTGTDFLDGSKVQVNHVDHAATYESDQVLDAIVPAASLGSFGEAQVEVLNPAPGGGYSSSLPLTVTESN